MEEALKATTSAETLNRITETLAKQAEVDKKKEEDGEEDKETEEEGASEAADDDDDGGSGGAGSQGESGKDDEDLDEDGHPTRSGGGGSSDGEGNERSSSAVQGEFNAKVSGEARRAAASPTRGKKIKHSTLDLFFLLREVSRSE